MLNYLGDGYEGRVFECIGNESSVALKIFKDDPINVS